MESVQSITLGNDPEQQIVNMKKILQRAFPDGKLIFICWSCNQVNESTNEEAAKLITTGWPVCHGRMDIGDLDSAPKF